MSFISKETFVKAINDWKNREDYIRELNDFFYKHKTDGYLFPMDCTVTVGRLLHECFGERDKDEWIEYFCYELDFGRRYEPGMIKDGDEIIDFSSAEALYDYLTRE